VIDIKAEKIIGVIEFFGDELPHGHAVNGGPFLDEIRNFFRDEF
jgi:hypothetical protein